MLGLAASLAKGGASLLTYVKDNLKLYLDFKSSRSDTLAFPSDGSTSFDGNDYISITDSNTLTIADGQGFTASIWFKTSTATEMYLFDNRSSSEGFTAIINANGTNYLGHIHDGSNALQFTNTENYNDGAWHHFAFTFNGTDTITSYIDGSSVGTGTQALGEVNGGSLLIGKPTASDTKYWNGKMANLAMWSRDLSPEEVQSVMNKSYSQLGSVEKTSLVMWQSLDSQSNGLVQPASGETLGSTPLSNTDFSLNSNWGLATGVTINTTLNRLEFDTTGTTYTNQGGLSDGQLYKITFDAVVISSSFRLLVGSSNQTASVSTTGSYTYYEIENGNNNFYFQGLGGFEGNISNLSVLPVSSPTGVVTGATTTTSVYGGNAPILPRAIDIAESFADKIGNGSALFNGSSDIIDIGSNSILDNVFVGGATLTAWIKPSSDGENNFGRIFDKSTDTSGTDGWHWLIQGESSSKVELRFGHAFSGSQPYWDSSLDVILNEWNHVAVTYDNSSSSNNPKFYINGISVAVAGGTPASESADDDSSQNLFIGNNTGLNRTFDGSIASAGIWQGLLSQEKIQSLMEATSYAKIPANVKSNLGSEKVTNATDWTDSNSDGLADNWSEQYSGKLDFSIVTGNGFTANAQRFEVNDVAGNDRAIRTSATVFTSGTLYKVSFKYRASISSGSILVMDGGSGTNVTNITTHTGDAKLFETYYVAPTGSHLWFYMQNADANAFMEIDEVSVKEVINDLVAYYPLDADNSNTVKTDDLVGGETLGSNFVDDHQESHYSHIGTTMDNITNGVKFTYGSNANGGYVYLKGASILSGNLNYGNLYKATFNAYYEGGSSGVSVSIYQGAGSDVFGDVLTTSNAEYSIYFIPLSAAAFIRLQNFASSNIVYLTNLQIQEVTSNTGVLL